MDVHELARTRIDAKLREIAGLQAMATSEARRLPRFSFVDLLRQSDDGLRTGPSAEICQEAARVAGRSHDYYRPLVPFHAFAQRDLLTSNTGAYLTETATTDPVASFSPLVPALRAGMTVLNLTSSDGVIIPVETTPPQGYWVAEGAEITASQPTLQTRQFTPKTGGSVCWISRQLVAQSNAETFVVNRLRAAIATLLNAAIFNGAGGSEPLGLLNVPTLDITNGASLDWADVLEIQGKVAASYAPEAEVAWIAHPDVREVLAARETVVGNGGFIWSDNAIAGAPAYTSAALPAGTLILGHWPSMALALWNGGVQLAINPRDPVGFRTGMIGVRCLIDCETAAMVPAAFAAATGVS